MSSIAVSVFKIFMLFCILELAYGNGHMVLLSLEPDIKEPCIACECGAESRTPKKVELQHEMSHAEAYVYYFTVKPEENIGSCSCMISWEKDYDHNHESSEGKFLVYDSHIAQTYGSEHPFYMMLQAANKFQPESFIVWIVTEKGVYPPSHPQSIKIWTKTKRRESCFMQ